MSRKLFRLPLVFASCLMVVVGLGWMAGCGGTRPASVTSSVGLEGPELAHAKRLYAKMVMEHQLHRDRKTLEIAGNLLDYHSRFQRNDEVLDMAIDSADRLGEISRARRFVTELLTLFPESPLFDKALQRGANLAATAGDTLAAAHFLVRYHDRDPVKSTSPDGTPHADIFLEHLVPVKLAQLMSLEPDSRLWTYMGFLRVRELLKRGEFGEAERVVDSLEVVGLEDHWTVLARELLEDPQSVGARPWLASQQPEKFNQIGLLSPLTEKYALLGNAFVDAALMALDAANQEMGTQFELKVEDTAGDPVTAALAARRLCSEEGSIAVLGALMSAPTAAAALVNDIYGVPMVSPTATNDNLWKLGPGIFQTNMAGLFEVRLLAQLAVTVLLKERFAILYPDNPEGRRDAEVFAFEVEALGGQVVARASYLDQGTDFKDPILSLREYRPEVIFTPATVDQMVMLGPQLDFYKSGSMILGLSNLNSDRLIERAGSVLERSLLPSDLAMFQPRWTSEFNSKWVETNYPREATPLALKAYQATRMLLDTIQQSGATNRAQLTAALGSRLASREFNAEGLDSFGQSVRMFDSGEIIHFPAELFAEAWVFESALADSLGGMEEGDFPEEVEPGLR
ncbi:MAG: ABC transporter substrate-binding protein [Gemmatimonadales bacterium]|nr:ABC transporter substrate-binding protein [Gemmatimonadales bacterium]